MLAFRLSCQKAAWRSAGAAKQRPGGGFTRRQRIRIRLLFGHNPLAIADFIPGGFAAMARPLFARN